MKSNKNLQLTSMTSSFYRTYRQLQKMQNATNESTEIQTTWQKCLNGRANDNPESQPAKM